MTINHAFINLNADVTDDTITRPSDWNDALIGTLDLANTTNDTTDVKVTGILPIENGGTGQTTIDYTNNFLFMGG